MLSLSKYKKAGKILGFCLPLFISNLYSQNLIKNSSFDIYTSPINCGGGGFDNYSVVPPNHVVNDWYSINSPDYFHSTCNPSWYNAPNSFFGDCHAKTGNAYAGIGTFDIRFDYQEYIYQSLATPLKADSIYCLSFFVSRADRFPFAVKQVGAFFSNNLPTLSGGYINASPQVTNNTGFLTDTVSWVEIQGCFTAQGGEQYITIGNFNTNANIDTLRIQSTNPLTGTGTDVAYYYIDSVSLWKNNFPTGTKNLSKDSNLSIYPNPANSTLYISDREMKFKNSTIEIKNYLGQTIFSFPFVSQINISELSAGIYFLTIRDKTVKFIKQ